MHPHIDLAKWALPAGFVAVAGTLEVLERLAGGSGDFVVRLLLIAVVAWVLVEKGRRDQRAVATLQRAIEDGNKALDKRWKTVRQSLDLVGASLAGTLRRQLADDLLATKEFDQATALLVYRRMAEELSGDLDEVRRILLERHDQTDPTLSDRDYLATVRSRLSRRGRSR